MKTPYRVVRMLPAALVAVSLGGVGATAMAASDTALQSVKIEASKHGDVTQLSQQVSYGDLDLATKNGADELASRIQRAATNVCGRLGTLYPAGSLVMQWEEENLCVNSAVNDAMKQARIAIDSVRSER